MKNLPIGIQTLSEIRIKNGIYVDKTRFVHKLVTEGKYYFLSRPRRFGKSLLISTFKELYLGKKSVFEGLWIYDKWDWTKTNPILHFSFDDMSYHHLGLKISLENELKRQAKNFKINLTTTDYKSLFKELLEKLSKKHGKVVLLIDEYDKPIIDYLENNNAIEQAQTNRLILRDFYGVLKNADPSVEFVFITGISKFSKVSIFSLLNNLNDITLSEHYGSLTGYTEDELKIYFSEHIDYVSRKLNLSPNDLLSNMRLWYNGYSWDGIHRVFNPFGTLQFFDTARFQNFWFSTGIPYFLVQQMRKHNRFDVENVVVSHIILEKYDIENLELIPLLFQTGYLTVQTVDAMTGDMVLDYPNKEVRESMYQFLIDDLAKNPYRTHTGHTIKDLNQAFLTKNLPHVQKILNALLSDLPSETFVNQREGLYHGLIHLIFSYLGLFIHSEVHSSQGRADAVVETPTDVYIFEFKFNKTAKEAFDQIVQKQYANKFRASEKSIIGIGVNFNSDKKQIDDWFNQLL